MCPKGMVCVLFDDGQDGYYVEYHTPEEADEIERQRALEE
jgi:hypothetical protein